MKRETYQSDAFISFYEKQNERTQKKIDYILNIIESEETVNTKFVKKLTGTDFYEMRISVNNEYRIILFTLDNENFQQATKILLLNGFIKKSTKEYEKQIAIAENIIISNSHD